MDDPRRVPTDLRPPRTWWGSLVERDGGAPQGAQQTPAPEDEVARRADWLSRRGFLRAAGFTAGGSLLTSCARAPVEKAIPLLVADETLVPGRSLAYASTCAACPAACGLLMTCRDGRPVKLEGNPAHPLSRGGLCAVGQASILGLYDRRRLRGPRLGSRPASWDEVDRTVVAELDRVAAEGGAVRVLTATIPSPTMQRAIDRFLARFADARHVVYDPLSASAILAAHARTHGRHVLPRFRFERAEVIVSCDADFLGAWISPVEHAAGWREGRELGAGGERMSHHVQLEGRMSLTGSNADRRLRVAPDELGPAVATLAAAVARRATVPAPAAPPLAADLAADLDRVAARLWAARGRSLVVCGSQDVDVQVLVNLVNHLVGAYGTTLDIERPSGQRRGSDRDLAALRAELEAGTVAALLVVGCNPVYDLPGGASLGAALDRVPLLMSCATHLDETAVHARVVCPDHHPLEGWGDAAPAAGVLSLRQPGIRPLFDTRAAVETLAVWAGAPATAYDQVRAAWRELAFARQTRATDFERFWDQAVESGVCEPDVPPQPATAFDPAAVRGLQPATGAGLQLVLHPQVGMHAGQHADNAWLHELPDPVTKVTWDNVASLSPATARRLGIAEGDVVRVMTADGTSLELPAHLQPGQHDRVVAVALGYGRAASARFADAGPRWLEGRPTVGANGLVGANAAVMLHLEGGTLRYARADVRLERTGRRRPLACTQTHDSVAVPARLAPPGHERRPIIQECTLAAWQADPQAGAPHREAHTADLWPDDHPSRGHRWGMTVDLAACTGCSACVVACQVENNVPVVGRDEVRRRREMHWLRVDRYYAGDDDEVDVAYQPMLCQQCDHAPCETVCPVLATVHSAEGLNQQVYNRCVGTRYCANNCPYKVRRFNWFAYARDDRLADLVLNPDVTVRSRGVMEKCTFCVQRIESARIAARQRGEPIADGSVQPACQQTCPTRAIAFGDLDDPASAVSASWSDPRCYRVLEELGVEPSVGYLRLVRNREEAQHG